MMLTLFLVFMCVLGAVLGSFACCQARRLHFKETTLKQPKNALKRQNTSQKSSPYGNRSICDHCHRKLRWYENIPIFSWLFLRGRCKKCHKKIGFAELFSEFGLATVSLILGFKLWPSLSSLNSPFPIIFLVLLIVIFTILTICFIYDALWGEFPSFILYTLLVFGIIFLVFEYISGAKIEFLSLLAGIGILPGVYYLLYFFSREKLVGSGDWLLCLPLALILHNFWLCFFVLFLSNSLAVLIQLPITLISKKKSHQFPFGPFLIIAFLVIYFVSDNLLLILF